MVRWKIDEALDLPLAIIEDTEHGTGVCEIGNSEHPRSSASEQQWKDAREIVRHHNNKEKTLRIKECAVMLLDRVDTHGSIDNIREGGCLADLREAIEGLSE